ncbi:hypothetical protein SRHO_G00075930 [Serrasalmus rhombeus]
MQIRWKIEAVVRSMSKLECNKQKASPKYQHPSTDRIMLNGITITPSNRSARARDITSMLSAELSSSPFDALLKRQEKDRKMVQSLLHSTNPPVVATVPHGKMTPQVISKTFVESFEWVMENYQRDEKD